MSGITPLSPHAVSSLRLGALSLLFNAFTGGPAIVQGVRGLEDVRRARGQLRGRGPALAGISLALVGTALWAALAWAAVEKVKDASDRAT
jgi:hypothetical protein